MRRFLNNRISNYNNVGDKVDDFCEDCENRWLPFSRVWWDSTEKNIADIKRKDNGIFVIKKILSLINSISESIKDIYDRINVIEPPILSEKLLELENDYLEVGVTADDKQEDLNIAIYENYINLKNTKVDKPLIESTSDSLKIVALDNQGESVFIKSNELGKVKSVNNKIGGVILKASDLENDSDYTTNFKLNQERSERTSIDNLKVDKPTTDGTVISHPNIVGVDDLGNSAKLKASDFGKVKSVNGKEGDVILKTSDLENDSDYTTNATLTAHTSNKANPHNVTKEQIGLWNVDNTSDLNKPISTATQTELNKKLDKPTTNNTPDYVLLADGSTVAKSEFGKVDKVMGVPPDANKNFDISGVAMNWTNASQRFSGILGKSADATFNALMGLDSNGIAAKVNGKVIFQNLPDFLTEAEKTAWKTKMNGGWTTQTMSVFAISPLVVPKLDEYNFMVISGANLNLNPVNFKIEIISAVTQNVIAEIPNNQVNLISSSSLNFYYNFKDLSESEYKIKITNGLASYITPLTFYVKNNIDYINLSNNTWETWKHNIDSVIVTETPQILQTSNTLATGEYYNKVVNTKLSKILFEASDNFVLTYTVVQTGNTNANPNLKIGLTDLSDVNNLDNNIIQVITRFSGPELQNSINGSVVSTNNNSPVTVTIIKYRNKITQIIATTKATSIASTIVNILSPIRIKVLFHGVSETDATSKIQFQSAYKF